MEYEREIPDMDQRELSTLGVLGVLAETESATIDDVRGTLQHNFGNYWGASTGVLSPTMTNLEDDGHVEMTLTDGIGTYRITEAGADRLQSLLREPVDGLASSPLQPQLVIKLGFLYHLSPAEQRREIDALADRLQTARVKLGEVRSLHETEVDNEVDTGYRGDLIRLRIFVLDALLDWLDTIDLDRTAER